MSRNSVEAWPEQTSYFSSASRFVQRVLRRLGVAEAGVALVAFPKVGERLEPIVARNAGFRWALAYDDWKHEIFEIHAQFRGKPRGEMGSSFQTAAFYELVKTRARTQDETAGTRTFLSAPGIVWPFEVVWLVDLEPGAVDQCPSIRAPGSADDDAGDVSIGLLPAVIQSLFTALINDFGPGVPGDAPSVERVGVDGVLRQAGAALLRSIQRSALGAAANDDLFEQVNAISALEYEGRSSGGGLVIQARRDGTPLSLSFTDPVPLDVYVWARKVVELSSRPSHWIATDGTTLLGLALRRGDEQEFRVSFTGQSRWRLTHGSTVLAEVRHGLPALPAKRLDRARFGDTFRRVFGTEDGPGFERIWTFVEAALEHSHGTTVVVARSAPKEAARLDSQATPIAPALVDNDVLLRATAIDGAILMDVDGVCHAVGVILDGHASVRGNPARGARFNSAVRYVGEASDRLVVVVSEDGHVDLFPRLRPVLEGEIFDAFVSRVRALPPTGMPSALRRQSYRLMDLYWDYIPEDVFRRVIAEQRQHLDDDVDEQPRVADFEPHPSDFRR